MESGAEQHANLRFLCDGYHAQGESESDVDTSESSATWDAGPSRGADRLSDGRVRASAGHRGDGEGHGEGHGHGHATQRSGHAPRHATPVAPAVPVASAAAMAYSEAGPYSNGACADAPRGVSMGGGMGGWPAEPSAAPPGVGPARGEESGALALAEMRLRFASGLHGGEAPRLGYEDEVAYLRRALIATRGQLDEASRAAAHATAQATARGSSTQAGRGGGGGLSGAGGCALDGLSVAQLEALEAVEGVYGCGAGVALVVELADDTAKPWLSPPQDLIGPYHPAHHTLPETPGVVGSPQRHGPAAGSHLTWKAASPARAPAHPSSHTSSHPTSLLEEDSWGDLGAGLGLEDDCVEDLFDGVGAGGAGGLRTALEALEAFERKIASELDASHAALEASSARHASELRRFDVDAATGAVTAGAAAGATAGTTEGATAGTTEGATAGATAGATTDGCSTSRASNATTTAPHSRPQAVQGESGGPGQRRSPAHGF